MMDLSSPWTEEGIIEHVPAWNLYMGLKHDMWMKRSVRIGFFIIIIIISSSIISIIIIIIMIIFTSSCPDKWCSFIFRASTISMGYPLTIKLAMDNPPFIDVFLPSYKHQVHGGLPLPCLIIGGYIIFNPYYIPMMVDISPLYSIAFLLVSNNSH